ncbi:hypothetical protein NYF14_00790 [Sphingobium sp. 10 DY56-G10]|uniref:hypothetical protein n=1 Tax=Sphingomonadales TaxID=204457 RepID=UPI0000D7BB48|nr:hypothetical protein [Sphingomonas sp. SKA58]EAT09557.1 hypothetical protein SKA58_14712 [Sphingomonas sp. SKA58]|tara:strand:- start:296 stop:802 length:507 start_codon:yes stop_codon:yes gene_type:complete
MDIVSGIGAVTSALGIAKTLRGIEKTYDEATYKAQVADLINALTDAKLAMADAKESLAEKDKEIERLRASFESKARLVPGDGGYSYLTDENANPVGYPVCPKCEQVNGRIIQTKEHENSGKARCPACSEVYTPVVCYLPQGGGFVTKQHKESADWNAAMSRSRTTSYF